MHYKPKAVFCKTICSGGCYDKGLMPGYGSPMPSGRGLMCSSGKFTLCGGKFVPGGGKFMTGGGKLALSSSKLTLSYRDHLLFAGLLVNKILQHFKQ